MKHVLIWLVSIISPLAGVGGLVHWRRRVERRRFLNLCFRRYYYDLPEGCKDVLTQFTRSGYKVALPSSDTFTEILIEDGIIDRYFVQESQNDDKSFFMINKSFFTALKALTTNSARQIDKH